MKNHIKVISVYNISFAINMATQESTLPIHKNVFSVGNTTRQPVGKN